MRAIYPSEFRCQSRPAGMKGGMELNARVILSLEWVNKGGAKGFAWRPIWPV